MNELKFSNSYSRNTQTLAVILVTYGLASLQLQLLLSILFMDGTVVYCFIY